MSDDHAELLRRYDDPLHWEYPVDFDYEEAIRRFRQFAVELESHWGKPLPIESDGAIQDASFHSQIKIPLADGNIVFVRFSNFGNMATFTEDIAVPEDLKTLLISLLEKRGYVYMPAPILDQRYSGINPGVSGISTWWIRYFDYV